MRTWQAVGAKVPGARHTRLGQECQDDLAYRAYPGYDQSGDTLIAAVADGAGSAARAACGAFWAVRASKVKSAELLCARAGQIDQTDMRDILTSAVCTAQASLSDLALKETANVRDFSTTLLLVIHAQGILGAAQIGDGAIVCGNSAGDYSLFTAPQRGEFANETKFLTGSDALQALQIRTAAQSDVRRIAMFTDGIQPLVLAYNNGFPPTPHPGFFTPIFGWLEAQPDSLQAYTGLRGFLSKRAVPRTDDDVTLLLATRTEA